MNRLLSEFADQLADLIGALGDVEAKPYTRITVLIAEVGAAAGVVHDIEHHGEDMTEELIQCLLPVAAQALAWIDALQRSGGGS